MDKTLKTVFISAVMAICLLITVCTVILPRQEVRANEVAVAPPSLFVGGSLNMEFLSDLEDYFSANFAFRQQVITANSHFLGGIFTTTNTDSVILGKDGWLYYSSTAEDFRNEATITGREAANIAISLSLAEEYANANGAEFLFVPAPNKNTVYPRYMPAYYSSMNADGSIEMLCRALNAEGISHLDLRGTFAAADEQLYHRLDSHWNNAGAALAQLEIMHALGLEGTDYSLAGCETRYDFHGDLYEMLYPSGKELDKQQYYEMAAYTAEGNSESVTFTTQNPEKSGSLLMYRDSFGNALAPFLAAEFGSATFSRSVPYDMTPLKTAESNYFVIELAERNIANLAERAIIMEAPVREMDIPLEKSDIGFTAELSEHNGLTVITGRFDFEATDVGSRVYAVIGETVYEASPVGSGGEGAFTLYLDGSTTISDIALILSANGTFAITESISLS